MSHVAEGMDFGGDGQHTSGEFITEVSIMINNIDNDTVKTGLFKKTATKADQENLLFKFN